MCLTLPTFNLYFSQATGGRASHTRDSTHTWRTKCVCACVFGNNGPSKRLVVTYGMLSKIINAPLYSSSVVMFVAIKKILLRARMCGGYADCDCDSPKTKPVRDAKRVPRGAGGRAGRLAVTVRNSTTHSLSVSHCVELARILYTEWWPLRRCDLSHAKRARNDISFGEKRDVERERARATSSRVWPWTGR